MTGKNSEPSSAASATGEFGFCSHCGEPAPVKMLPADRLQERLRTAFDRLALRDGLDVEEFAEQLMEIGVEEIQAYGLLDHGNPARLEIAMVAMMQALILMERHLAFRLEKDVDLLRLATERVEAQLEERDGQ